MVRAGRSSIRSNSIRFDCDSSWYVSAEPDFDSDPADDPCVATLMMSGWVGVWGGGEEGREMGRWGDVEPDADQDFWPFMVTVNKFLHYPCPHV